MLYRAGTQIAELREIGFPTEKAMQQFCEKNMETLLGLRFVATEFSVAQFRFDSVAYNATTNAFVIIEYKNDRNFSVVDQGYMSGWSIGRCTLKRCTQTSITLVFSRLCMSSQNLLWIR